MELECIKYKEKVDSADPVCRHPDDYCKYRTSCIIQFMSSEDKKQVSSEMEGSSFTNESAKEE